MAPKLPEERANYQLSAPTSEGKSSVKIASASTSGARSSGESLPPHFRCISEEFRYFCDNFLGLYFVEPPDSHGFLPRWPYSCRCALLRVHHSNKRHPGFLFPAFPFIKSGAETGGRATGAGRQTQLRKKNNNCCDLRYGTCGYEVGAIIDPGAQDTRESGIGGQGIDS